MIMTINRTSPTEISFSEIVEKISRRMEFLTPTDLGPWIYK